MSTLDCENLDTLRKSLLQITGNTSDYETFLSSFDIYDFYDSHPGFNEPEDVFSFLLRNEFKVRIDHQKTCWFHTTRSKKEHTYTLGLLPLNSMMDKIWEEMFSLINGQIRKDEWLSFRHSIETNFSHHNASIYRDIIKNPFHWGPYGFLAKDLDCFDQDFSTWHYFDAPEIVLDICRCANEFFKIDLLKLYQESTVPCVVKFEYEDHNPKHIGLAMFYWYMVIKGEKISQDDNICFSTRGEMIGPNSIKNIQFYNKQ